MYFLLGSYWKEHPAGDTAHTVLAAAAASTTLAASPSDSPPATS